MDVALNQVSPETQLVVDATRGDKAAFEALVERYQRAVFNIALYKSKNYFDAEDLAQDIFLAAYRALPTLKTPESFGAWICGIAYNRCHKWFRRERTKIVKIQEIKEKAEREDRSRQRPSAIAQGTAPGMTQGLAYGHPVAGSAGHGPAAGVSETLSRLPSEIRETLTLKYLEGLSYDEIAQRLGINAHRIDYLIRKGKQMIRDRLKRPSEGGAV